MSAGRRVNHGEIGRQPGGSTSYSYPSSGVALWLWLVLKLLLEGDMGSLSSMCSFLSSRGLSQGVGSCLLCRLQLRGCIVPGCMSQCEVSCSGLYKCIK